MPNARFSIPLICTTLLFAFGLPACEKGPTPEQLLADEVLAKARAAVERGEIAEGRKLLRSSISMESQLGRARNLGIVLAILGDTYAAVAQYDSAIECYRLAQERFREVADRRSGRSMTLRIAGLRRETGEERAAHVMYTEALRLAKVFKDAEAIRDLQMAMLPSCRALDLAEDEQKLVDELTASQTAAGNVAALSRINMEEGISERLGGRQAAAIQRFFRAATLAGQARDTLLMATVIAELGPTYEAAGNFKDAFQHYSDALKVVGKRPDAAALRIEILTRIGNAYLKFRQYSDAARFYRLALGESVAAGNRVMEGYCQIQLGLCLLDRSQAEAVKSFESALKLFRGVQFGRGIAYALECSGIAQERAGQVRLAIDSYAAAVDLREEILAPGSESDLLASCEDAGVGEGATFAYDSIIELLLQNGRYDDAFTYAERRNSANLYRLLGALDPVVADKGLAMMIDDFQHARWQRIGAERRYLQALQKRGTPLEVLRGIHEAVNRSGRALAADRERILQAAPALAPLMEVAGVSMADIQKRIPVGAALIQFLPTRRALYSLVVTQGRRAVRMAAVDRDRVLRTVKEMTGIFQQFEAVSDSVTMDYGGSDLQFRRLIGTASDWFTRPIISELSGVSRLIVVASREFSWFPIHALQGGASYRSPYMADLYTISYVPLARTLLLPPFPQQPVREVVSLGIAGTTKWDVEYELRDIRAFYKDARLYFSRQATLDALQHERADLLHIAVPLTVYAAQPGNSFLVLSDGKSATTTHEVLLGELLALPRYPSVVISNLTPGSTVLHAGVPYLFLAGGSSATVMTGYVPWRTAKKYFSEVFYTTLLAGVPVEAAFRKVQTEMIRTPEYSSPLVWAPYFLWGK